MRHLDDELRRALLVDRQLVGDGRRAQRGVVDVVELVGPLHSTDPSSAYLQVAARSEADAAAIAAALYEDRALLRHTTLRRTVHLLTPALARDAHGAYNHRVVPTLRSNLVEWLASAEIDGHPAAWLADVEDRVVAAVERLDRPSGAELADLVPELQVTVDPMPGRSYSRPIRITSKVLEILIADGRLGRDRPRGQDLTSGAWTYSPITHWLPEGLPNDDPSEALGELLRDRMTRFPGCSEIDLAWWTGLPKGQVRSALRAIEAERVVRDDGVEGWIHADDDLEATDAAGEAVALLPGLDATPMGVKQRDWFLGGHESALFDRNGNVGPTVWHRGRVVGGWTQRRDGAVVTKLLQRLPAAAADAVDAEAERIRAWLGDVRVKWRYPTPLQRSLELA